jgi:hypothetical protein
VERPVGDLDQGAWVWDEAKFSAHAPADSDVQIYGQSPSRGERMAACARPLSPS